MIMIKKDRLIWGSVLGVIGMLIIIFYGFLLMPFYVSLIIGVPLLVVGIIIIFNKSEDTIEKRKDLNN